MRKIGLAVASTSLLALMPALAQEGETRLLRDPALSADHIAFVYGGDLWLAARDGSAPQRLTTSLASESDPVFSPDGSTIAYAANFEGNWDVYTIPVAGGQPTRLTWHSSQDIPMGWTADGREVAFASRRETNHGRSAQLYHVSVEGGLPEKQMAARFVRGTYNAAGDKLAYNPTRLAYNGIYGGSSGWKGYRGGASPSVTLLDLDSETAQEIPGDRVNDIEPMWIGDQVYFVSDREDKIFNLYRFNPANGRITRLTNERVWDIRSANAHGTTIIYEVGGRLKTLDVSSNSAETLHISINPDSAQLRPQWKDASKTLENFDISSSGKRVLITARGEVFSLPTKDGSPRNISNTDGAREYSALWSGDGQSVAYIDAGSMTQALVIRAQDGLDEGKRYNLGDAFYTLLAYGPKGDKIIYQDNHLNLYAFDLEREESTRIATNARRGGFDVAFSPDGSVLAYTTNVPNFNSQLRLYDFARESSTPVGDTLADAASPAFSPDGQYLYFAASTNSGPLQVGLDMSSQERPYRAGLYVAVLQEDGFSPVHPKSGDEEAKSDDEDGEDNGANGENGDKDMPSIDFDGLSNRITALEVEERNYSHLHVGKDGNLYYIDNVQAGIETTPPGKRSSANNNLSRYNFEEKKVEELQSGITAFDMSADGEHLVMRSGNGKLSYAKTGPKLEAKPVDMSGAKLLVDPRKEWAQIFDEAWRMEAQYFYDPNMHGLDWQAVYDKYKPLLPHVVRREDLNTLIVEMIAEMQVGHNRAGGGDIHREKGPGVGLLGADLALENGRHRIMKIYTGENWNPYDEGPLAAPGVDARVGDYIIAVNGQEIGESDNIFTHLQGTVGKQVTLRLSQNADGQDARDVVVTPIARENTLRLWNWVEDNRKAVLDATDGRVGYIYLPNTAGAGYTFFNRMFFAQVDKDAMIIDERSNGGGQAANYITDVLSRTYLSGWKDRDGLIYNTPGGAMFGPKVMLIDQDAGSGGDFLPYAFRHEGIGPLIGKRTWGGLIGISANPRLMDGGFLTVPFFRYFDTQGNWSVENEGVAPDIDVTLDPLATNNGRDTQLERAIEEVKSLLETNPSPVPTQAPPYPDEVGQ